MDFLVFCMESGRKQRRPAPLARGNSKNQAPENGPTCNAKPIGRWFLSALWSLGLGAWIFAARRAASVSHCDVGPPRIGQTGDRAVGVELDGVDSAEMAAGAGGLGQRDFPAALLQGF